MNKQPINSVIYLGDKRLTSGNPLYLKDKLVERIYYKNQIIYRITTNKGIKWVQLHNLYVTNLAE